MTTKTQKTNKKFDYFDVPQEFWDIVDIAISLDVIRPKTLYQLAANNTFDIKAVAYEILNAAYADRNSEPYHYSRILLKVDDLLKVLNK